MVSDGLVLAGETNAMPADWKIGWIAWPTDEFNGPTTPTISLSPVSFVAAFLPASGLA